MRSRIPLPALLGFAAVVGLTATFACGSDGTTPDCPEVTPLYNVREAGVPAQRQKLLNAPKNCATPLGHALSSDASPPDSGAD